MEEDSESDQMFEEVRKYLSDGTYYEDSDKAHKPIVRRSKKFELQDGTLKTSYFVNCRYSHLQVITDKI